MKKEIAKKPTKNYILSYNFTCTIKFFGVHYNNFFSLLYYCCHDMCMNIHVHVYLCLTLHKDILKELLVVSLLCLLWYCGVVVVVGEEEGEERNMHRT